MLFTAMKKTGQGSGQWSLSWGLLDWRDCISGETWTWKDLGEACSRGRKSCAKAVMGGPGPDMLASQEAKVAGAEAGGRWCGQRQAWPRRIGTCVKFCLWSKCNWKPLGGFEKRAHLNWRTLGEVCFGYCSENGHQGTKMGSRRYQIWYAEG